MRVYAFTDLHGDTKALARIEKRVRREAPELLLCCGDLTVFEHGLHGLLARLDRLGTPVLMLHGNHESEAAMREACAPFANITFLHEEIVERHGFHFAAYGGGGFEERYPRLERLARRKEWRLLDWSRCVFLSHAPPFGTRLDDVGEEEPWHVGSRSLRRLAERCQPLLLLAGHIHECFGTADRIGLTPCENPGPEGALYDLSRLKSGRTRRKA